MGVVVTRAGGPRHLRESWLQLRALSSASHPRSRRRRCGVERPAGVCVLCCAPLRACGAWRPQPVPPPPRGAVFAHARIALRTALRRHAGALPQHTRGAAAGLRRRLRGRTRAGRHVGAHLRRNAQPATRPVRASAPRRPPAATPRVAPGVLAPVIAHLVHLSARRTDAARACVLCAAPHSTFRPTVCARRNAGRRLPFAGRALRRRGAGCGAAARAHRAPVRATRAWRRARLLQVRTHCRFRAAHPNHPRTSCRGRSAPPRAAPCAHALAAARHHTTRNAPHPPPSPLTRSCAGWVCPSCPRPCHSAHQPASVPAIPGAGADGEASA